MKKLNEMLVQQLNINQVLYLNSIHGINEETGDRRVNQSNSIKYIAGHLADSRYFFLDFFGHTIDNPFKDYFEKAAGIDDMDKFPSFEKLKESWENTGKIFNELILSLTEEQLYAESARKFPFFEKNYIGAIFYMIHHETYHIGQIGILRRILGLNLMDLRKPVS